MELQAYTVELAYPEQPKEIIGTMTVIAESEEDVSSVYYDHFAELEEHARFYELEVVRVSLIVQPCVASHGGEWEV